MHKNIIIINTRVKPIYGGEEWTTQNITEEINRYYNVTYVGYPFDIVCNKKVFPFTKFLLKFPVKKGLGRIMRKIPITKPLFVKKLDLSCDLLITNSDYDDIVILRGLTENIHYNKILVIKHSADANFREAYPDRLLVGKKFMIVVLNKTEGAKLSKKYGEDKISVIPTGMKFKKLRPIPNYLKSKGIKSGYPILFSIGRLEDKQKNFSQAIYAMSYLKKNGLAPLYLIGGEGRDRKKYESLIKHLNLSDNVKLLGKVSEEEKHTLFSIANIVLLPSKEESLGLVMVEALKFGSILLTTKTHGSIDAIKDGYNAFFTGGASIEIAKNILKILSIDNKNILKIKRNARISSKKFDFQRMIISYRSVIDKLLNT